jgi:hypothetical protein
MADKIIQNPSITTNVFEYDGAGRVSAISGHPLAGQGGGEVVKSDLMWKPNVESDGYVYWTLTSSATTPEAAYISGAQGPQGPSGTNGTDGADGTDGISPTFTITPIAGGTHVTISGAQGEDGFDVLSGAKGADGQNGQNGDPGADGYSPTVALTPITAGDQTGTEVTFTYGAGGEQTTAYTAWNGKDGTSSTDYFASTTISGDGTQALPYGVDTTAAINFTNASAKFAEQYWDSLEEDYAAISDDFALLFNSMSAMEEKFADYYAKTQTSAASSLSAEFAKKLETPTNIEYFGVWDVTANAWGELATALEGFVTEDSLSSRFKAENGLSAEYVSTGTAHTSFGLSAEYENAIKTVSAKSDSILCQNISYTTSGSNINVTVPNNTYATISGLNVSGTINVIISATNVINGSELNSCAGRLMFSANKPSALNFVDSSISSKLPVIGQLPTSYSGTNYQFTCVAGVVACKEIKTIT